MGSIFFAKEMKSVALSYIFCYDFFNQQKSDTAFKIKGDVMDEKTTDMAIQKLREDKDFQNALKTYEEAEEKSSTYASELSMKLVDILNLKDQNQTIQQARHNLVIAKMTVAKMMATLSSFSYEEKDFLESLQLSRECVQKELVPMLMQKEPCGECVECKNGHPERCIRPNIRSSHCESRFLPLLCDSLIEYDAWSEILYNNIPIEKRDVDILGDINDDFKNEVNGMETKKRRGRPPKKSEKED